MKQMMKISPLSEPRSRNPRGTPAVNGEGDREEFRGKLDEARGPKPRTVKAKAQQADEESPPPTPTPTPTLAPVTPTTPEASPMNGLDQLKALLGGAGGGGGATKIATPAKPQPQVAQETPDVEATKTQPEPQAQEALTPLEQAVHDLIGQIAESRDDAEPAEENTPAEVAFAPAHAAAPAIADEVPQHAVKQAAPVREVTPPPEAPANPSHVHLVLDDAGERVVVTVAVRGNDVNVSLRGSDENTAAALARNAANLDHALRARGLDLNDFTAERDRDPSGGNRPPREQRREQHGNSKERFVLEENV